MSRMYVVSFEGVAVSSPQDLFEIRGAAGKLTKIRRWVLSATDTTAPTSQMLQVRARFLPSAGYVAGSTGTIPTRNPIDPGDAAASFTAMANNTTKSTATTPVTLYESGCHVLNGLDEPFDTDGRGASNLVVGPSESIVLELLSTVSGTVHLSSTVWVEESGG